MAVEVAEIAGAVVVAEVPAVPEVLRMPGKKLNRLQFVFHTVYKMP